jgi:WD40 repeat protein
MTFAPDGQGLATAADDGTVRLWAISRIRCWERVSLPHATEPGAVAFAPNARSLVTGSRDGVIRVWDPSSLKPTPRAELTGHTTPVRLLHVMSDSITLVSVADGPRVLNWDLPCCRTLREWDVDAGPPGGLALTPDGRYLAVGRPDGPVDVYRVAEKR